DSIVRINPAIFWLIPVSALGAVVGAAFCALIRPLTTIQVRVGGFLAIGSGLVGRLPFGAFSIIAGQFHQENPTASLPDTLGAGLWIAGLGTLGIVLGGRVAVASR